MSELSLLEVEACLKEVFDCEKKAEDFLRQTILELKGLLYQLEVALVGNVL